LGFGVNLKGRDAQGRVPYKCQLRRLDVKKYAKKSIVLTLVVLMILGIAIPAIATRHLFNDVDDDQWYSEAVQFVYEHNIMGGVGNNQFNPQGHLTRAAAAAVLFRAHNGRTANADDSRTHPFTDVPDDWSLPYIAWAYQNNIVMGSTPTTFNPNGNVTRQEFATMMYRHAMNMADLRVEYRDLARWFQFVDRDYTAPWATQALMWVNSRGVITGSTTTTINPTGTASRAEVATMMMRFMHVLQELETRGEDFVLTISVEETSLPQGEPFRVHVELENNSGEDHEIVHTFFFVPQIPDWDF